MKKKIGHLCFALGVLASQTVMALPYSETGDAGNTLATAQSLNGGVTSISGHLDSVDIYRFSWGGGLFSASTSTNFDPMLTLYDQSGGTLAFNDDYFGLQSYVSRNLMSGNYFLAISFCCGNYGGAIGGFADTASHPGGNVYTINLNAVTVASSSVPEPASLVLMGLGLAGLGVSRRKRD